MRRGRSTRSHCFVTALTISLNVVVSGAVEAAHDGEDEQDLVPSEHSDKHPTEHTSAPTEPASSHHDSGTTKHDSPSRRLHHGETPSEHSAPSHPTQHNSDSAEPGSPAHSTHYNSDSKEPGSHAHPTHYDQGSSEHSEHKHHAATLLNELNEHTVAKSAPDNDGNALVHPGPCQTMRTQLLDQINQAEKRGVGVWTYRDEFKRLNQMVDEGISEEKLKRRIMAIVISLHGQIRTSLEIKNAAIRKARQSTITKESILIRR